MRRLKIILELFSNPEYRVELSVVLFLLIGLSLTILVHQITLGGVEDLLASDMKSTQYYERNLEELQNLNDHLSDLDTELNVYIFNNDLLKEATIRAHIEQINKGLDRIGANLSGNAEEKRQFNSINQFVKQKIVLSEAILRRYNTQNVQRAKDLLLNQEQWSKQLIDSIEHISTNLRVLQQNNLKANITSHQQFIGNARRVEFVTTIIVFAIVSISILYLLRETSQRLHLQEKLAFAKEEAERSARIKEQFMANMSHEIRTPLNAIVGFTNLLKNTPLNARQQEYVESMRYSGENLIAIVNDILDLSKMEAEMTKLEEVPFHFKELLHNLEALFRYRAEEKGIDFQFIVDAEIPDQLIGDPNRLMQIFTNLLNNAIKFTDQGEVTLRATLTEKEADQSALICVEVQDTGIGIPKNQLHKVFERFSQVYSDSTRKYGGAGLGLTIVKYLIELLNGTIKVESEEGAGTKFTVSLPFLISTDMQAQPFPSPTTNVDNKQFSFKSSKILMVEDNPMNRRVIELLLDSWELQLEQAENGKQALELVRQNQYDLILMDIQMPELDGYHTTRIIRNKLKGKMPIIAMTAHVLPGEREKCLRYGMNDYLSKPLSEKALFNVLARFLPKQEKEATRSLQIDMNYLEEVAQGESSYVRELAQIFLEHLPKELATLEQALAQNDFTKVKNTAHSMRSTVGYIGFGESLGTLLKELEEEAQGQEVAALVQHIKYKCEEAMDMVKHQLLQFSPD